MWNRGRPALRFLAFAALLGCAAIALSQERIPIGHRCSEDEQGNIVCSKYGGGDALLDRVSKQVVCGRGHCQVDFNKKSSVSCAKTEDGVAAYDRDGRVVCSGGCEPASAQACEKLLP